MNSLRRKRHHHRHYRLSPLILFPSCFLRSFLSPRVRFPRFATKRPDVHRLCLTTTSRFMIRDILYPKYYTWTSASPRTYLPIYPSASTGYDRHIHTGEERHIESLVNFNFTEWLTVRKRKKRKIVFASLRLAERVAEIPDGYVGMIHRWWRIVFRDIRTW